MAVTEADCEAIVQACMENKTIMAVGHVLRYTPHVRTITELMHSGYVCLPGLIVVLELSIITFVAGNTVTQ